MNDDIIKQLKQIRDALKNDTEFENSLKSSIAQFFADEQNHKAIISHLKVDHSNAEEIITCLILIEDFDHVDLVGSYLYDLSAGDIIVSAFLSEERLERFEKFIHDSPVADKLKSVPISQWSNDIEIKRFFSKIIGSGRTYFEIAKLFLDKSIIKATKELFIDSDYKTRIAAAKYISYSGSENGLEYLKTGLLDSNEKVRIECREAIEHIFGKEKLENIISEISTENESLRDKAAVAYNEIKGFLTGVPASIKNSLESVGSTFTRFSDQIKGSAKNILKRNKDA
jgi:hypothetical protein